MSLQQQLDDDLKTAMKAGEKARVGVLRMLRAEMTNARIERGHALDEAEILDVLTRYARKRRDAAAEYEKGGRQDLVDKELAEADIVQGYLPQALGEGELLELVEAVVRDLGAGGMQDMGRVMKETLQRAAGRADGAAVSALVKRRLAG
ncbi:MAG: GatB/YqeY domain-containing protein [Candidatus Krumholzibacteriia bacterium]|nr:GatB/YqeY domain-containing protein [bacterium]MCB9512816.1 GatB/YqeY domain-containing protein [Candidatus Latescibacterota bacterium]MCB9516901.1 GatB/YqeY domain-containing protein [Candidatus Latescibacterota bacterium]